MVLAGIKSPADSATAVEGRSAALPVSLPAGPAYRWLVKPWAFVLFGIVLLLLGALWTAQGLGYVTGSFMTGSRLWATIGPIVMLLGLWSVVIGVRRRARSR